MQLPSAERVSGKGFRGLRKQHVVVNLGGRGMAAPCACRRRRPSSAFDAVATSKLYKLNTSWFPQDR
jgi:hypothetical protein